MDEMRKTGRVTIPTDLDVVPETLEILKKWGADAIRDCDGTDFPQAVRIRQRSASSWNSPKRFRKFISSSCGCWRTERSCPTISITPVGKESIIRL